MALTISNNGAVQAASYHLGKAQQGFDISLRRLASGKKVLGPNDDPGTLGGNEGQGVHQPIDRCTKQYTQRNWIPGSSGRIA